MIAHITLENFKNVSSFDTDLNNINVLVGANNSGKSSVLQGIHFTILAEVVRRREQRDTLPQQQLLYVPSADFSVLRHDAPYSNYSGNTSKLTLISSEKGGDGNADTFDIKISKGRNYGNISVSATGNNPFRQRVTSPSELYSVYVPGISGISVEEKLQAKSVVRHAAANGDANLYLRNILYYTKENGELDKLNSWVGNVFPGTSILLPYDPDTHLNIIARIMAGGKELPIELSGTGFLQIVQIMAYVMYFKPKLLLLDEPDEHLHPDNQQILAQALMMISEETGTQIILSTHSRHMISALEDSARFIWLKDGSILRTDASSEMYEVLLDIGALDSFDKVICGQYTCVVLTEDQSTKMIKLILKYNGFDMSKTLIVTYKGCSNVESALQLSDFIHSNAPNCKVIIHRDRDFMTEDEVTSIVEKVEGNNRISFVTDGSDIESYFVAPCHIALSLNKTNEEITDWLSELARENHVEIQAKFQNKREEIKNSFLYRDKRDSCPSCLELFGYTVPTVPQNRMGKFMLKRVREKMKDKYGCSHDLLAQTSALEIGRLRSIASVL